MDHTSDSACFRQLSSFLLTMLSTLYLLLIVYFCGTVYGSKGNPNPAMLKGKTAKMRVMLSHSLVREQKGYRKSYVPDFASVFHQQSKVLDHNNDDDNMIGAKLYVRKFEAGLWNLLHCLPYDDDSAHLHTIVSEGGIEAENTRHKMDKWVATKVFGTGMGDPLLLNSVRKVLPQLKKLKAQQLQFGYRAATTDDICVVDRSMVNNIPSFKKRFSGMPAEPQIVLSEKLTESTVQNILKVLKDPENVHKIRNREDVVDISALNRQVLEFTQRLIAHNVSRLIICTDGSASFNDAGCVLAAGGVAVAAVHTDSQGVDKPVMDANSKSVSLFVRVCDMECMTTTPFDAELASGLAGLVLTKLILNHHRKLAVPTATVAMMEHAGLAIELCSDSRSYCRALRTDLSQDLTSRNEQNRLLVWQLASGLFNCMVASSNTNNSVAVSSNGVSVVWAAGHPERSNTNPASWTARQQGLWAADCIAKPRTSGSSSAAISANIGLTGGGIDSVTMPLDVSAALELPTLDIIRLARALLH